MGAMQTYLDVLEQQLHILLGCKILHIDCLSSCELINLASRLWLLHQPLLQCHFALPCGVELGDYLLPFSIRQLGCVRLWGQPHSASPTGSGSILSDLNTLTSYLPPTHEERRKMLSTSLSGDESSLGQACLGEPLLAQVYRKPCFF